MAIHFETQKNPFEGLKDGDVVEMDYTYVRQLGQTLRCHLITALQTMERMKLNEVYRNERK